MMVKPISMTISTRPPISPGAARSLVSPPSAAAPAATTQTTSRNQVGISITARSEPRAAIDRISRKPIAVDGGDRNARDARGDRRVVDRQADHRRHHQQPDQADVEEAHVPAAQIEIGEQEDDQRRADRRLDAGAPDALGLVVEAEDLSPEAEVDADIGEHRPGERRGGGKDQRAAHDEDDGQEQRQQAGDADQDALVERQARALVLVGVGLPQIELRQRRRAQLGDIGDGRAGIEGDAEHVGVELVLALGRAALAGGDGGDARRAEVGPDHARADEAEMRRDDEAGELLVGIVGQREDDPRRLRARLQRADLDAADDAVGAGRGRHLDAVALGAVMLDRVGQVDRVGVDRHAHRLHRLRRPDSEAEPSERRHQRQRAARPATRRGPRQGGPRARQDLNQDASPRPRAARAGRGPARRR